MGEDWKVKNIARCIRSAAAALRAEFKHSMTKEDFNRHKKMLDDLVDSAVHSITIITEPKDDNHGV